MDALLEALDRTKVRLVGVRRADEVTSAVGRRRYLHAGPPLASLDQLVGPMRAALAGALVYEGEAATVAAAYEEIQAGNLTISPCHEAGGVGPMAGIVTPRMPVVVVETDKGRRAFAPLNEGLGKALRYGMNDEETLGKLTWLSEVVAPLLDAAIGASEPVDMPALQAEGLRRGDECHNRNVASSAALVLRLSEALVRAARSTDTAAAVFGHLANNPQLFLSFSAATAKAVMDEVHAIGRGSVVTTIASNGRQTGIRVSGCGARWFVDDAPIGSPKLRGNFSLSDVCPSMGDSAVVETSGLGAFAFSAAPALCELVGGDPTRAVETVDEMRPICIGTSSRYLLPVEGYRGTPIGIDVHAVSTLGVAPLFSNGLSHKTPGIGVIGAGLTRTPLGPFREASQWLNASAKGAR